MKLSSDPGTPGGAALPTDRPPSSGPCSATHLTAARPSSARSAVLADRRTDTLSHRPASADLELRPRHATTLTALDRSNAATAARVEAPPSIRLARTLPEFQRRLNAQKERPVDLEAAAAILAEVRYRPLADADRPSRHGDLAARVTPERVVRWNAALGLTNEMQCAMDRATTVGGRWIPTSGSLFLAALYGAIPFAALYASPVHVLYGGLVALVLQPFVTAGLETPIMSAITLMREKAGPVLKLPGNIKARETLPAIERAVKAHEAQAARDADATRLLVQRLAARHQVHGPGDGERVTGAHIGALLAALHPDERAELEALQQRQTDRAVEVGGLVLDALRLEGMQDRQFYSTTSQAAWRVCRAMSGIFAPALQAAGAPAGAITATSVVLALGALAGQHMAAGADERKAQAGEHVLALLYGDLCTSQGQADYDAGRPVTAAGIDAAKLRNLFVEPETAIAGRVAAHVARHRDGLQARLDALRPSASADDPEQGRPDVETLCAEISACDHDLVRLDDLDVEGIMPGGVAHRLLMEAMKDTSVVFAWRQGVAKLRSPLEYSAQLGQRFAQQFAFIGAGGAGAVALTGGVGAATGGASRLAAGVQVGLSLGAGVLGALSALTQYTAVNVKNARLDCEGEDAGFLAQLGKGLVSPLWQRHATASARAAHASADAALDHAWRGGAGTLRDALGVESAARHEEAAAGAGDAAAHPAPR